MGDKNERCVKMTWTCYDFHWKSQPASNITPLDTRGHDEQQLARLQEERESVKGPATMSQRLQRSRRHKLKEGRAASSETERGKGKMLTHSWF